MTSWSSPYERRMRRRRRISTLAALLAVFLVLYWLDRSLFHWLYVGDGEPVRKLELRDWYRTLRVTGTLWPWLFIGAAMWLYSRGGKARGRAAWAEARILAAAAVAGGVAEFLQMLTGRLRPNATDGLHVYRGWDRFTNTSGLGLPSSHAAVAFAAAFMVAFIYPRAGVVAVLAAMGCGLSRMLAGAHFATDVFVAAVVGYAMARLIRPGGWRGDKGPGRGKKRKESAGS